MVKNFGGTKHWQIELSFFANIPGYARDHAVCGVNIRYLKQVT